MRKLTEYLLNEDHTKTFHLDGLNHQLNEMATIGEFRKYIITIWSNDPGNIPHFHIKDSETNGGKFHTCVKIETPEYFHHTGKEDVLNSRERKDLMRFLNSDDEGQNVWKYLLTTWNKNNSSKKVDLNQKIPDYTKL